MKQRLLFTHTPAEPLGQLLAEVDYDRLFLLCDSHTGELSLPLIANVLPSHAHLITIEAGEANKSLDTVAQVWNELACNGATRHSLLVNLGGGMVTDLGGFAASCFKRGIRFINIPTTLLGAVDAAVGGKTGVNFNGLKNEVGVFRPAEAVIISTRFFETLPVTEFLSGYAEMIKHALIEGPETYREIIAFDPSEASLEALLPLLRQSIQVKEQIVAQDPTEQGVRKVLNLGHTIGHAIESLSHRRESPVPHGYAVAWGLVCELLLSHHYLGFPSATITQLADYIYRHYGAYAITCKDYDELYEFMRHDKKNMGNTINFTLLRHVGEPVVNQQAEQSEIDIALDLYRDLFRL